MAADRVYEDASLPTVKIEVDGRACLRLGSTARGPVALWLEAGAFLARTGEGGASE